MPVAIILRGVPGSGKTTLARKRFPGSPYPEFVSADHYFTDPFGTYRFDPAKLPDAHNECLRVCLRHLASHRHVVVDNTNVRMFEIAPYYRLAEAFGYEAKVVWVHCDPLIAARRNVHGVPVETVLNMARSFDPLPPWWNVEHVYV